MHIVLIISGGLLYGKCLVHHQYVFPGAKHLLIPNQSIMIKAQNEEQGDRHTEKDNKGRRHWR